MKYNLNKIFISLCIIVYSFIFIIEIENKKLQNKNKIYTGTKIVEKTKNNVILDKNKINLPKVFLQEKYKEDQVLNILKSRNIHHNYVAYIGENKSTIELKDILIEINLERFSNVYFSIVADDGSRYIIMPNNSGNYNFELLKVYDKLDFELYNNIYIYYKSVMSVGSKINEQDRLSENVFKLYDTNSDKYLSYLEVETGRKNLEKIIYQASENLPLTSLMKFFGKEFSDSLKYIDKNSSTPIHEQIAKRNFDIACDNIINYSSNHTNDIEMKKYADKLIELLEKNKISLERIDRKNVMGLAHNFYSDKEHKIITLDNHKIYSMNSKQVMHTLLHELTHVLYTPFINSIREEYETEKRARILTLKIFPNFKFNETLEEFKKGYSPFEYPETSPGYDGLPKNLGIPIWFKPRNIIYSSDKIIIQSDNLDKLNGDRINEVVFLSNSIDENNEYIPTNAYREIIDKNDSVIFKEKYGFYFKKYKYFSIDKINEKTKEFIESRYNLTF